MKTTHTPEEIAKRIAELPEPIVPEINSDYYTVVSTGDIEKCRNLKASLSHLRIRIGNCFATKEHAQAHFDFRKWLYEKPKLTLQECYEKSIGLVNAPERFIQLARENGHL